MGLDVSAIKGIRTGECTIDSTTAHGSLLICPFDF